LHFSTEFEELRSGKLVENLSDWINFNEKDRKLAMMNILSSNISQHHYRKYIKISEILASVGGLIKVLIFIFTFIHKPFVNLDKFNILFDYIQNEEEILNYVNRNFNLRKAIKTLNNNLNRSMYSNKSDKNLNENKDNNHCKDNKKFS